MVQQKGAATAPPRTDLIRPPSAIDLLQRPASTLLQLDGKERITIRFAAATESPTLGITLHSKHAAASKRPCSRQSPGSPLKLTWADASDT
jgi:hypothetical protein